MLSCFRTATEFILSVPVVILGGTINDLRGSALLNGEALDTVGRGLLVFMGTVAVGLGRFIGAVAVDPARFMGAVAAYPGGRFMGVLAAYPGGRFMGPARVAFGTDLVLGSMFETNGVALVIEEESPLARGGPLA
jgi:hypothetical protein